MLSSLQGAYVKIMSTSPQPGSIDVGKPEADAPMKPSSRVSLKETMVVVGGRQRDSCEIRKLDKVFMYILNIAIIADSRQHF
jgi:hypothetical protein